MHAGHYQAGSALFLSAKCAAIAKDVLVWQVNEASAGFSFARFSKVSTLLSPRQSALSLVSYLTWDEEIALAASLSHLAFLGQDHRQGGHALFALVLLCTRQLLRICVSVAAVFR